MLTKSVTVLRLSKKVRIGYMKIKDIRGLLKVRIVPISREDALKLLRGERSATEGKNRDKV